MRSTLARSCVDEVRGKVPYRAPEMHEDSAATDGTDHAVCDHTMESVTELVWGC